MSWLGGRSIRSKLVWLSTAISVTAVLLVTAVTSWHAYESRRYALEQELTAAGAILAANLEASLLFHDREASVETLSTLGSSRIVTQAALIDANGSTHATFGVPRQVQVWPTSGIAQTERHLLLTVPIRREGQPLGELRLSASLDVLDLAVREIMLLSGAVLVAATILSWLLATLLARTLSRPIEHLAGTMKEVSDNPLVEQRATRSGDDEFGALIDGFNRMLDTVQRYHGDLLDARDRAEKANQAKARFLASMSHELRTPLNAIMGFAELIRDRVLGNRPEVYHNYAQDIHTSAKFLLSLINDLLDMSRLDSQTYKLHETEIDARHLLEECMTMMRPQTKAKHITMHFELRDPTPALYVDDRGLRQVLLNLIGNAVKFTPRGGTIRIQAASGESGTYVVVVSDDGPGIPPEDLERVMQPFEQSRVGTARDKGGTGLGLSISAALMELHGGSLTLESTLGQGTTARVVLPAERVFPAVTRRLAKLA